MTFDKVAIRQLAPILQSQNGEDQPRQRQVPVESVRFTFRGGKEVTLNIADYTSGQAMIDAAQEWADKQ
jgi:hypothetical protein